MAEHTILRPEGAVVGNVDDIWDPVRDRPLEGLIIVVQGQNLLVVGDSLIGQCPHVFFHAESPRLSGILSRVPCPPRPLRREH